MNRTGFPAPYHLATSVRVTLFLGLLFVLAASPAPAQSPQDSPPLPAAKPAPTGFTLGPEDLIQVAILESPELNREVRVALDGTIALPLLENRLRVAGLTISQAEALIAGCYREAGIFVDPNVTISVKELQSKPVTVTGAVRNPGVVQIQGPTRLLRIISQSGGLTEEKGTLIQVIRAGALSADQVERIPIEDLQQGILTANIEIRPGDTVNVPPAGSAYVMGAVNRPGRYFISGDPQQMTVIRLLAMASDLAKFAKADRSVLLRRNPSTDQVDQIPVDIKKILKQEQPDVRIVANDVLWVPDSAGKRAFSRGLEAALQMASAITIVRVGR